MATVPQKNFNRPASLNNNDPKINRPYLVKPNIVDRCYDENNNVLYLICDQEKQWCPKAYERLWGTPEVKVIPRFTGGKFHKGKNPNTKVL